MSAESTDPLGKTSPGRWLPAVLVGLAIPALAPFLGRLRDVLFGRFGDGFLTVLAVLTLGALALGGVWGLVRLVRWGRSGKASASTPTWVRLGFLGLAAGLVVAQVLWWGTGNQRVDLVERIHLIEYGTLALLAYRAFRPRHRDLALPLLTLLAVALVGSLDEMVQWLTPVRVGDARDVLLNLWAGAAGVFLALAVAPLERWSLSLRTSGRDLARWGAVALVAVAWTVSYTRLGFEVVDGEHGLRFLSHVPAETLRERSRDRAEAWRADPPESLEPLSLEDTFLTEAARHVQERNEAWGEGDLARAFSENRILEVWYPPFLELSSMASGDPHRWPPEQRREAEAAWEAAEATRGDEIYESTSSDSTIYDSPVLRDRLVAGVPPGLVRWGSVILALALLLWTRGLRLPGLREGPEEG